VAIDINLEELLELEDDSSKLFMDATRLGFVDDSFHTVTALFSLMFMPREVTSIVYAECRSVPREGGEIRVWEPIVEPVGDMSMFAIPLVALLPGGRVIETDYGSRMRAISLEGHVKLAEEAGLMVISAEGGRNLPPPSGAEKGI
jgi:hypothetical protein